MAGTLNAEKQLCCANQVIHDRVPLLCSDFTPQENISQLASSALKSTTAASGAL